MGFQRLRVTQLGCCEWRACPHPPPSSVPLLLEARDPQRETESKQVLLDSAGA